MKLLNKAVKAVLSFLVHVYVVLLVYFIAYVVTSPVLAIILSVVSLITHSLPECVIKRFFLVGLIAAIPMFIILMTSVILDQRKLKKESRKRDSE